MLVTLTAEAMETINSHFYSGLSFLLFLKRLANCAAFSPTLSSGSRFDHLAPAFPAGLLANLSTALAAPDLRLCTQPEAIGAHKSNLEAFHLKQQDME